VFEGQLVRLRAIAKDDLPRFVAWINDQEVARHLDFYRPISLEDEERWFAAVATSASDSVFTLETVTGEHIGSIGLHQIDTRARSAMLGVFIGEKRFWGKGYGTEAVQLLLEYAFDQLNLHRVFLYVHEHNPRAVRCYQKCGFVQEGTLRQAGYKEGKYFDILVMGILDDEFRRLRPRV